MTQQQVRKSYRNHRKAAWGAVLVVLVAAALAIVLPATAVSAGDAIPPAAAPSGVTPTLVSVGGSNFSCSANTGYPAGTYQTFQVPNPPQSKTTVTYDSTNTASMSTPLPAGVTFRLSGLNGQYKGQFFAFKVSGAAVFHAGVKGGTNNAWYDYVSKGGVTADGATAADGYPTAPTSPGPSWTASTGLHATPKDPTTLYVASFTTFCYRPVVKLSGTVYGDQNSDGSKNGSDTGINGRTVSLIVGGSTSTTTTVTDANNNVGTYTLYAPTGSSYTVCETDQTNSEAQTQPSGNTACGSTPDIAGYTGTATADVSGLDFGLAGGVLGACDTTLTAPTTAGADSYTATFSGSVCKVSNQKLVMNTWRDSTGQYASLRPSATGLPECAVSTGDDCVTVLEELTWSTDAGSTPKPLKYDDTLPYTEFEVMPFCKVDPDPTGSLAPAEILPLRADSTYHTSCLYRSTQTVKSKPGSDSSSLVWYVEVIDSVYSAQDSSRAY